MLYYTMPYQSILYYAIPEASRRQTPERSSGGLPPA